MSNNPLPEETNPSARVTPNWLWAMVGGVMLVALAAGGYAGFQYGREYERTQGCPGCYPDETFWLLGASMVDSGPDVLVQGVAGSGPAEAAGLQNGDRVITIEEQPVNSATEGRRILHDYGSGAYVNFTIEREHKVYQFGVSLGGLVRVYPPIKPTIIYPMPTWEPPYPIPPGNYGERNLGVTYKMIEPDDPSGVGYGAMLIQIWDGSPADSANLNPGDIILAVDGRDLSTVYTLEDALGRGRLRSTVTLSVRKTSGRTVSIKVFLYDGPIMNQNSTP